MADGKLNQLYSFTYSANHAFSISVMHDTEAKYNPYFIFLSIAPGETGDNGRTFNFKNSISMKIMPVRIAELGHALTAYAKGQRQLVGNFSIMVDSSKSSYSDSSLKKSISLMYNEPKDESSGPTIILTGKTSEMQKGHGIALSPTAALALADVCGKVFEYCLGLEMGGDTPSVEKISYKRAENASNNPAPSPKKGNLAKSESTFEMGGDPF